MTGRPRLLDLFCGAGGAAMGYHRAGFDVVGVDIKPQPRFPFEFHQADAMTFPLDGYHAIHASPPCQFYTTMAQRWETQAPDLIAAVRSRLQAAGRPYVIENVLGARRHLRSAFTLTGEMFGLGVHRPRLFETSELIGSPPKPPRQQDAVAVYGKMDGRRLWTRRDGTELRAPKELGRPTAAMGIDWMEWDELREAIPPAYTEWIGRHLLTVLENAA